MSLRFRAAGLGLAIAPVLLACGGASFDGRTFKNDELSFRLAGVPPGWRSIEATGSLLAFRDDGESATVSVSGRCGRDGDDVPLESLTHHLFLQFTEREAGSQERVALDGRDALHTELDAKLDGVTKHFSVFVLKKNGCVYDFVRIAPPSASAESNGAFRSFVQGFSTVSP